MVRVHKYSRLIKKKWTFLALSFLCITLLVSHTFYVIKTHQFPAGGLDEPVYLSMAVNFYDFFKEPSFESIFKIFEFNKYRQPLYGVFLSLPLLIFGTYHTYKIALWINIIFYLVTVIATYFLGREFLSKKASFFAAFIFAFYGFPLFYLHFTYSETFVTCLIVLSLLFLARTDNFKNRKNVILFSIFFTLGNLSRWVVPIFVGGPLFLSLLISVVNQIKKKARDIGNFLINLTFFILLGILPVLVMYYIPNFSSFQDYVKGDTNYTLVWVTKSFGMPELQNTFSTQSIVFYFNILAQQTIFFLILFIVGFIISIKHYKSYLFFLLSFIFSYIILTLGAVWKQDRYIVPIYPIMALLSAVTFDHIRNRKIVFVLIVISVIIGSLNFLGASWGIGPMKFNVTGNKFTVPHSILVSMPIGHPRRVWFAPISWPPRQNESNAYLIVDTLRKDWGNKNKPFRLLQTFEMSQVGDGLSTIFSFEQRGVNAGSHIVGIPKDRYDIFFDKIKNSDYVMVKNGIIDKGYKEGTDKGWDSFIFFVRRFNKVIQEPDGKLPEAFVFIKTIFIPFDGSNFTIYRKKREITQEEWRSFGDKFSIIDPDHSKEINHAIEKLISQAKS